MAHTPVREAQQPTQVTMSEATVADGASTVEAEPSGRLGRFVVLRKVGVGGMGVVYAAYDDQLDRKVAIKLLHVDSGDHRDAGARCCARPRRWPSSRTPTSCRSTRSASTRAAVFIAMEFVEGQTLGAWRRGEAASAGRGSLAVFVQAGRGLAAAHAKGLVHRDFKPDNVMVGDDGRVRVHGLRPGS